MNKKKVTKCAAPVIVTLGAFVLAGIMGTFLNEQIGYSSGFLYLFGIYGTRKLSNLLERKMSK
jgi:hypothetical protein